MSASIGLFLPCLYILTTLFIYCLSCRNFASSFVKFQHILCWNTGCLISILKSISGTTVNPFLSFTKSSMILSALFMLFSRNSIMFRNKMTGWIGFFMRKRNDQDYFASFLYYWIYYQFTGYGIGRICSIVVYFFCDY